ncbi:MAG: NAD(P)/FAD-dependent oxidoreductase [Burkholderiales bacterium]|nr:NAD(P)/FAD-dependent oxidoreductase [Burkholderiales bacterium]
MSTRGWDAIVVGSGIGGLACAAALAKTGYRVLVLEQHAVAGGLTHTFSRAGYAWNVGVHYIGEMGPGGRARAVLDWLTGGAVEMARIPAPHDVMHFPGGFEIGFAPPESALRLAIRERFPSAVAEIDAYFVALADAERAGLAALKTRAMPSAVSRLHAAWHHREVNRWCGATTAAVLARLAGDARLAAVLGSQWLDYGGLPSTSSFAMHALVMRSYLDGAHYPAGGASAFAGALAPVIRGAGGEVRTGARVSELVVKGGRATGVRLVGGETFAAPRVISDAGARNTVVRLLPSDLWYSDWAQEISALDSSACHVGLYLGFEGDIRGAGASASNHWFHESWGLDEAIWLDPGRTGSVPPVMFVSFPTLKDPRHETGGPPRHTAEVVALSGWDTFGAWEDTTHGHRPDDYLAVKAAIERNLLHAFRARFPALAPMIRHHEVSTPLTTIAFTGARQGAIYGLESTPRRLLSAALRPKTPVPGLFLAGQDVATPGIVGAMMGGMMAAAAVDPRLYPHLRWEPASR